jgi:hypothetical protein
MQYRVDLFLKIPDHDQDVLVCLVVLEQEGRNQFLAVGLLFSLLFVILLKVDDPFLAQPLVLDGQQLKSVHAQQIEPHQPVRESILWDFVILLHLAEILLEALTTHQLADGEKLAALVLVGKLGPLVLAEFHLFPVQRDAASEIVLRIYEHAAQPPHAPGQLPESVLEVA